MCHHDLVIFSNHFAFDCMAYQKTSIRQITLVIFKNNTTSEEINMEAAF